MCKSCVNCSGLAPPRSVRGAEPARGAAAGAGPRLQGKQLPRGSGKVLEGSVCLVRCGTRCTDVSREPVVGKGLQELALWSLEVTPSSQEGRRNPGVQTLVLLRDVKLRLVMFKKI